MSWTDERIAALTKLWENGATASQIADELGGVSRNAVIGKAHRLGLKARPSPVKSGEKKISTAEQAETRQPAKLASTAPAEPVEKAQPEAPAARENPDEESRSDNGGKTPPRAAAPARAGPPSKAGTLASDPAPAAQASQSPRVVSVGPGGFLRQGPGDQQAPIPPAPPRRLVPAKPLPEIADKTSLLELTEKVCRWPVGHPGEPDFHFCGQAVNPGFPYCVEHCGRAYQAQLPRGARRPPPPLPFGGPRVR